ncbi:hypothetical protein [Oryzomonas rubra]|uniref:Uncharacterized protein n=1 Tax=Oryzomonas rubra TaxID=2509454 RepID=A0A5A9X6L5_9BACT|nr:hypothetical protein [Oryzomonas rubra]KAA0888737.1 hypothetical protein ET418_15265 [Oryzomonas rubra]
MPRVEATATGRQKQTFMVWYGKPYNRRSFQTALAEVKEALAEAIQHGLKVDGPILHYPNNNKKTRPEEIPYEPEASA